jgi:Fur family ferric uptake transcriptional regulator
MNDAFKALLKKNRLSLTLPRRELFSHLRSYGPLPVAELIAALPQVDRATVYRTLETFRELAIVQDIITGGQKMVELTDRFSPHHHHLVCTNCGKSVDIEDAPIENRLTALARLHGFTAQTHQIEVSGLCANCQA